MRKAIRLCSVAILALMLAAPNAAADAPTITRSGYLEYTWIERKTCDFPIRQDATGSIVTIRWQTDDGTVRTIEAYPQDTRTVTNLRTGESYSYANGGPLPRYYQYPDGSFAIFGTGSWTWDVYPDETLAPGLYRYRGRWEWIVDAEGNDIVWHFDGQLIDICALLAPAR